MKVNLKANVNSSRYLPPSATKIINECSKFDVNTSIHGKFMGLFSTTFDLIIEGERENINSFISFLNMKGFKTEEF